MTAGEFGVIAGIAGGLVIPIVTLFYKQGKKDQSVCELARDVNGLGQKFSAERLIYAESITEVRAKLEKVEHAVIDMGAQLKFIVETVREIKELRRE